MRLRGPSRALLSPPRGQKIIAVYVIENKPLLKKFLVPKSLEVPNCNAANRGDFSLLGDQINYYYYYFSLKLNLGGMSPRILVYLYAWEVPPGACVNTFILFYFKSTESKS